LEQREYFVYIMSSFRRTLYVGVTNNLPLRVCQHRSGQFDGFTSKYKVMMLVYAESTPRVENAIAREKQIKRWRREKKERLILQLNPEWKDLAQEWGLAEGSNGAPDRRNAHTDAIDQRA